MVDINNEVSTYIDSSTISLFNKAEKNIIIQDTRNRFQTNTHFRANFDAAKKIYRKTEGAFDPTVMPLVNYWGFGYKRKVPIKVIDSSKVEALRQSIGIEKWTLNQTRDSFSIIKPQNSEIDFSAIAKGYAVDEIAHFLDFHYLQIFD